MMNLFNRTKKLLISALIITVAIVWSSLGVLSNGPALADTLQPVLLVGSNAAGQAELERAKDEFREQASPELQRAVQDPQGKVKRDINRVQGKAERDINRVQNKVERDIDRTQEAAEDAKSGILNFFN